MPKILPRTMSQKLPKKNSSKISRKGLFIGGFFVLAVVFLLNSCGHIKTVAYLSPPENRLGEYQAIEIPYFDTDLEFVPDGVLKDLPKEVAKAIKERSLGFEQVVYGDEEADPSKSTIVMFGEITEFRSATDISVEGGAIKFGEAVVSVHLSILDKSTGKEITNGDVSGQNTLGMLKGLYKAIAKDIVVYVSANY